MSEAWAVRVRGHLLSETGPVQEIVAVVPGSVLATAITGLPTPEVAARHPGRAGSGGVRLHAAGGYARSAATLRVSSARGATGRLAGEGRGHQRGATAADDRVRAALAAIAGHLAGEDGHHAADADARRPSRGGRL